jgi:hypothetical protein
LLSQKSLAGKQLTCFTHLECVAGHCSMSSLVAASEDISNSARAESR